MGPNGRRNLLASIGSLLYMAGLVDGVSNLLPEVSPATLFFWGTGLLTTSVLRKKS